MTKTAIRLIRQTRRIGTVNSKSGSETSDGRWSSSYKAMQTRVSERTDAAAQKAAPMAAASAAS